MFQTTNEIHVLNIFKSSKALISTNIHTQSRQSLPKKIQNQFNNIVGGMVFQNCEYQLSTLPCLIFPSPPSGRAANSTCVVVSRLTLSGVMDKAMDASNRWGSSGVAVLKPVSSR